MGTGQAETADTPEACAQALPGPGHGRETHRNRQLGAACVSSRISVFRPLSVLEQGWGLLTPSPGPSHCSSPHDSLLLPPFTFGLQPPLAPPTLSGT